MNKLKVMKKISRHTLATAKYIDNLLSEKSKLIDIMSLFRD